MNHMYLLFFIVFSFPLFSCNNSLEEKVLQYDISGKILSSNEFLNEIVKKNDKDPYVYCNGLEKIFKTENINEVDIQQYYSQSMALEITIFQNIFVNCDSKAGNVGLYRMKGILNSKITKELCEELSSRRFLISQEVSCDNFCYRVLRTSHKNFCTSDKNSLLTILMTDEDRILFLKDFLNPFAHKETLKEVIQESENKIMTLLLCFKRLKVVKKICVPRVIINNYFVPSLLKDSKIAEKYKKSEAKFIEVVKEHQKNNSPLNPFSRPLNERIQKFFLNGEVFDWFDNSAGTDFITVLNESSKETN